MLHFDSDYMEGMHPLILERLQKENRIAHTGYGLDDICDSAREKIRRACAAPEAEVYFLDGGTQTNAVALRAMLDLHEGALAAATGHINVHEAGAIEAAGHKVIPLPAHEGRLDPEEAEAYLKAFYADATWPHMVRPGLIYISHPTEYGTLYTKAQLERLRALCDRYSLYLYMDGARLGSGLCAPGTDVTLEDIARYCHGFYIGGTKMGALLGEALVFPRPLRRGMFSIIKQSGALLAKGWLLGVQFDTLFTGDLYRQCGKHAVDMAMELKRGLLEKGYSLYLDSPTNQQFVILPNEQIRSLQEKVSFGLWDPVDGAHTVARFVTSWATEEEQIRQLLALL